MQFNQLPDLEVVTRTMDALKANGFNVEVVANGQEAKAKVLSMLPEGAEVMNATSITLDTISVSKEITESGKYKAARSVLMDENAAPKAKKAAGNIPEWVVGSVHALTEDGHALIASNTGSQLPSYAYGADHVVWVVSTDKIVKDFEMAIKRIYEYTLPLESERAHKAYGVPGSAVNKLLVVNHENQAGRITIILVNEVLGF